MFEILAEKPFEVSDIPQDLAEKRAKQAKRAAKKETDAAQKPEKSEKAKKASSAQKAKKVKKVRRMQMLMKAIILTSNNNKQLWDTQVLIQIHI